MSFTKILQRTIQGQTPRQLSYFMPVYESYSRKTEKKPIQSVFNTAEFTYFHVSSGNRRYKPVNNKTQHNKWTTVNNKDSDRRQNMPTGRTKS